VVALGDVRGPAGGLGVRRGGGRQIAAQLVQVAADGVPAVPLAEHLAQPVGLAQPGGGAAASRAPTQTISPPSITSSRADGGPDSLHTSVE